MDLISADRDFEITSSISILVSQYVLRLIDSLQQKIPDWIPSIFESLQQQIPGSILFGAKFIIPIIIVFFSFLFSRELINYLLGLLLNISRVRKTFFQDQYIEGLWFDVIKKDREIVGFGHTTISYSDGNYQMIGEDFSIENCNTQQLQSLSKYHGFFHLESAISEWPTLKYVFVYNGGTRGYGEVSFISNDNFKKYNGFFINSTTGERLTYESIFISEDTVKAIGSINKNSICDYLKKEVLLPLDSNEKNPKKGQERWIGN